MKKTIEAIILFFIIIVITLLCFSIKNLSFDVSAKLEKQGYTAATIKVTSSDTMKKLKLYKKVGNMYILFYIGEPKAKEVTVRIPNSLLSEESKTDIKAVAINESGENGTGDASIDKIPPRVSMNPEETAKPSWTPPVIPTKPTPSVSTSGSPSQAPSGAPSQNPSTAPSPQPSVTTNPSGGGTEITGIKLNKNSVTLKVGEKDKLIYTVTPEGAHPHLVWRTEANDICSIEKDGTITGVSVGETQITIKADNGISDTCKVTVISNNPSPIPAPNNTPSSEVSDTGVALARAACELSYSSYEDENGKDVVNSNGYYGTKLYIKYRDDGNKPHGCCSRGMSTVVNKYLGFDTGLVMTGANEQYHYMKSSDKWKKIGTYKSGMENDEDSPLKPGDIVISTHHTCMYVGDEIPTIIYNEKLKGTDADMGPPSKDAVWVSGGWHAGLSLCICKRSQAHPSSGDGIIYRYVNN